MYLNALESQSIPDTDMSLICLPNQAHLTVQSPAIEVTKSPPEANSSRQSPVEANTI